MSVDWTDDNPHPHMALAQYSQGVPLQRKPTGVSSSSGTINGAASVNLVSGAVIDQPSFQLIVFLNTASGVPTQPFVEFDFTWGDTASGFTLKTETPILPVGTVTPTQFVVTGPSRMDTLTVTAKNLDTIAQVAYSFAFTQTSHVYDVLRVLETNGVPVTAFTRPGILSTVGNLASISTLVPATGQIDRLAATWSGLAFLSCDNLGNANPITVRLLDPGIMGGGGSLYGSAGIGIFASETVPAQGSSVIEVNLPYGPVGIRLINLSAVAFAPAVQLERVDQ